MGNARHHPWVLVKVNAQIDEEIARIVAALNRLPNIVTTESCQGDSNSAAWVGIKYLGTPPEARAFRNRLVHSLKGLGDSVSVEAFGERIDLVLEKRGTGVVNRVTKAIAALEAEE